MTTRPANVPPWKCGTSPHAARSSVDLPDPDAPASSTSSPGSTANDTSSSAAAVDAGIPVRDPVERERRDAHPDRHRAIPRRSANGSSAHTNSAAIAISVAGVSGAEKRG